MVDSLRPFDQLGQGELERAQRLILLGELAAGAIHELKNPLSCVMGLIQLARVSDGESRDTYLKRMAAEVGSVCRFLDDILVLARSPGEAEPCDMESLVDETIALARGTLIMKKIRIRKAFQDTLPRLVIKKTQIKQVLLNLLINAGQAMPDGGEIVVGGRLLNSPGAPNGSSNQVELFVSDTGVGIPQEHIDRLFDPFFTTKKGGTGLGLSIARRIVEEHGGKVLVRSKVGQGTTISIILPLASDQSSSAGFGSTRATG